MRDLWLSLHPRWADAIMSGRKTVELRRRAPTVDPGATAVLYATMPECAVIGTAEVRSVESLRLGPLWRQFGSEAAVTQAEFRDYFCGASDGCAIQLGEVRALAEPIGLEKIREVGLQPAQGWRYLSQASVEHLLGVVGAVAQAGRG
ncbi:MAG: ASCH domain-containing protein [Actinomycetia bacterium]|nr:ASCH domain-containing protein [Actinomycetes bacterium]